MKTQNRISRETKIDIHRLKQAGVSKYQVANDLGILYSTVRYWWDTAPVAQSAEAIDSKSIQCRFESDRGYQQNYVYMLGLYLGDGYINVANKKYGVYKLRISLDSRYSDLIERVKNSLELLCVGNKANIVQQKGSNHTTAYIYSKDIPQLFPQHGPGLKHKRPIVLEDWQQRMIDDHPFDFLSGLLHSDGCRSVSNQGKYHYTQYCFANKSVDIMNLFRETCTKVGVTTTTPNLTTNITSKVANRSHVELLDQHIARKR